MVFENSVFSQKDAQPQDEGLRETGVWGATPPTSRCTKGYRCALLAGMRWDGKKREETDLFETGYEKPRG